MKLPFPVECEGNIFGEPEKKCQPDVTSLTPNELKKFVRQCEEIQNKINNNTDDEDDDENVSNTVNSKYYNIKKFNSLKPDINSSLGLMHVNIASLNKHFDDLKTTLSRLKFSFDVIGISEHKINNESPPSNNIDLPGYNKFIFEPTGTTHGGTGFYIKNNRNYVVRDDLKLNLPSHFEAMFVEIILTDKKNLVVGCIYRHGSSTLPLNEFTNDHLEPILQKISKEKKECVLMGDFNVDFLKSFNNNAASEFYNTLSSYFFTPFILQPTRLRVKSSQVKSSGFSSEKWIQLSSHKNKITQVRHIQIN